MILGIDPGLRCLGWIVWRDRERPTFGVVRAVPDGLDLSQRVDRVAQVVLSRIECSPQYVACEGPHRRGHWATQEELARLRQALFTHIKGEWIEPSTLDVKRALGVPMKTKGKGARVDATISIFRQWPKAMSEFMVHKKDSQEAIADALGVALAAEKKIKMQRIGA